MPTTHDLVAAWAAATTGRNSRRYDDLIRDKTNALLGGTENAAAPGFFTFIKKPVERVRDADVRAWVMELQKSGLAPATVYARVSRLSSFYDYLLANDHADVKANPAKDARPAAPSAYGTKAARPLQQADIERLLAVVTERAQSDGTGALSAKRDLALLRFYFGTGARRAEIIRLRWEDVTFDGPDVLVTASQPPARVPGGRAPLVAYLRASDRWDEVTTAPALPPTAPLWLRHDRAAKGREAVTSHGFVYMLKKYAKAAGIPAIHLNQARHTAALRLAADDDPVEAVQQQLGYQSKSMARAYLRRLRGEDTDAPETDM